MGLNELEFFKVVVDNFTQEDEIYSSDDSKSKFIALINSPVFERFDRVDHIANIIYELNDEQFNNLTNFFGLYTISEVSTFNAYILNIQSSLNVMLNQKNLRKFEEHIKLSCHQRSFIIKNVIEAKTIADEAKEVALEAEAVKTKIYSEFIGILAIFTALTFSMMGSLQLLGNVFNDVKALGSESIGYAILISSIYLLVLYLLIVVMFVGMRKIIGYGNDYEFTPQVTWLVIIVIFVLFIIGLYLSGLLPGIK
jgi:hypothetical protein